MKLERSVIALTCCMCLIFCLTAGSGLCEENSLAIRDKIRSKYSSYDDEVDDISIKMRTTTYSDDGDQVVEIDIMQQGKMLRSDMDFTQAGMPDLSDEPAESINSVIYDGQDAWMISPTGKMKMPDVSMDNNQGFAGSWWWDYVDEGAVLIGSEAINGRDCYILDLTSSQSTTYKKVWITQDDLSLVQSQGAGSGPTLTAVHSNHQELLGKWPLPRRTDIYDGDKLVMRVDIDKIDVNTGFTDETFDPNAIAPDVPDYTVETQQYIDQHSE
ncbi:hypothetical protein ACFL0T_01220 [Candidatus Omnitrophota bacterium]